MNLSINKKNKTGEVKNSSLNRKDKDIIVEHKNAVNLESKKKAMGSVVSEKEGKEVSIMEKLKKFFESKRAAWDAPEIIKTNLIKGEVTSYFDWKNSFFILLKRLSVAFVLICVVYLPLLVWEMDIKKRGVDIKDEVDELFLLTQSKEGEIESIDLFHKKVIVAGDLVDNHIYWTNFFKFLEDNLLEDVYIVGAFSQDTSGVYSFAAKTKDFNTLAAQLVVFKTLDIVESVVITGGTAAGSDASQEGVFQPSIDFNFSINLKKEIFHK